MTFRMRGPAILVLAAFFTSSILQSQTTSTGQGSEDKNVPKGQTSTGKPAKPASGTQAAKPPKASPNAKKTSGAAGAAPVLDEKLFNAMKWRQVGPFRGGRVLAVTG